MNNLLQTVAYYLHKFSERKFVAVIALLSLMVSFSIASNTYITTLFLSQYPAEKLSYFYFIQSILFMLVVMLTQKISTNTPKLFSYGVQIFGILLIVVYEFIGLDWKYTTLFYCVFLAIVSSLNGITAWNIASASFNLREYKQYGNLLSAISTSSGIIVASLLPLAITTMGTHILPFIAFILIVLFIPFTKMSVISNRTKVVGEKKSQAKVMKYSIINNMILYVFFAVIVNTLIDFTLKDTLASQFSSEKIANYMAAVLTVGNILTLLMQLLATKSLLRKFGPAGTLMIIPLLVLLWFPVYYFMPRLATISILYLFYFCVNASINNISREMVLNVLPLNIRLKAKSLMKGLGSTLGAICASLIIFLVSKYYDVSVNILITAFIAIIMIYLANRIKTFYKISLKDNLLLKRFKPAELEINIDSPFLYDDMLENALQSHDLGLNLFALNMLAKRHPDHLPEEIKQWILHEDGDLQIATLKLCASLKDKSIIPSLEERLNTSQNEEEIFYLLQALFFQDKVKANEFSIHYINHPNHRLQAMALYIQLQQGNIDEVSHAIQALAEMIKAEGSDNRAEAAKILGHINLGNFTEELSGLLSDESDIVTINAVYSAAQKKHLHHQVAPILVQQLRRSKVAYHIIKVANQLGRSLVPVLEAHLSKTRRLQEMIAVIKALSSIEDESAEKSILNLLKTADFFTFYQLAKFFAYRTKNYSPQAQTLQTIENFITVHVEYIVSLNQLALANDAPFILKEIRVRQLWAKKCFLYLLAITNNPAEILPIIPVVGEALIMNNQTSLNNAIELIETSLSKTVFKKALAKVFDSGNLSLAEEDPVKKIKDKWLIYILAIYKKFAGEKMQELEEIIVLRNCNLFANLPGETLLAIAQETQTKEYIAGETIYNEGELPDGLYIISQGNVEMLHNGKVLLNLKPYDFFGLLGVIESEPWSGTAKAVTDCQVIFIEKSIFDRIIEDIPDVLLAFTHVIARYLKLILQKNMITFPG